MHSARSSAVLVCHPHQVLEAGFGGHGGTAGAGEEGVGEGGVLAGNRRPPEAGGETGRFARHGPRHAEVR